MAKKPQKLNDYEQFMSDEADSTTAMDAPPARTKPGAPKAVLDAFLNSDDKKPKR